MCLTSKHFLPKIAKTDIVCYKRIILKHYENGKYSFIAPYTSYEFDDSVINSCVLKPDIKSRIIYFLYLFFGVIPFLFSHKFNVHAGFIHAYAEEPPRVTTYTIFKCHIPKGALYYEENNGSYKFYAASVLVIDDMYSVLEQEEKRIKELIDEREKYVAKCKLIEEEKLRKKEKQRLKKIKLNEKKHKRKNKKK